MQEADIRNAVVNIERQTRRQIERANEEKRELEERMAELKEENVSLEDSLEQAQRELG